MFGEISNKYPKCKRSHLIKRTNWILPCLIQKLLKSGSSTFYTDANKSGKAGYKSENLGKVDLSPYDSV